MDISSHLDAKIFVSLTAVLVFALFLRLYEALVVKPKRLRSALEKQGIAGPPQTLLFGNVREMRTDAAAAKKVQNSKPPAKHNVAARVFPFFEDWQKQYGEMFVFGLGNTQIMYVKRFDVVKDITTCTSLDLGKPSYQSKNHGPLLGNGILTSNGATWTHQRKILAPELYMDKVKGMVNLIIESSSTLVDSWKSKIEASGVVADIDIDQDIRRFSGDVISKACFGSNFKKGQEIFLKLRLLQESISRRKFTASIPGGRHIPTKNNREAWALEREVHDLILLLANERKKSDAKHKDLLQMVLEGAKDSDFNKAAMDRFIVDNCKNIYLAGYETTAVSATWCLMLLALNPEWQDRVRAEVFEICGDQTPDVEMTRKMKLLTMVIHESLRLYPPVTVVSREAFKDMKFGNIFIPKGVNIWTSVATLHTDPEVWGLDSYEFKPERFANGVAGACKLPHLYMPFGVGPRVCLGQNLAMMELKILISLILSNFTFSISPKYIHSMTLKLVIEPENGVNILVRKL